MIFEMMKNTKEVLRNKGLPWDMIYDIIGVPESRRKIKLSLRR